MRQLPSLLLIGLLGVATAAADTIYLNDGSKLDGDVKRNNEGWVVIGPTGKMTYVQPGDIKSIQMSPATNPSANEERVKTLRRSVESMSDIRAIIDRYEKFIATAPDADSKKAAVEDLAEWNTKLDRGLVKFGNQWIEAGDKAKVQEQSLAMTAEGRDYIKQGRLKEAEPILDQAIKTDPGNASAMYLRGVLAYRQDQFPQARRAFEDTLKLVPDHAPTLNNLAVTLQRQNQTGAAFHNYDRAMMVAPDDRTLLTNVNEALEMQREQKSRPESADRAAKRFDEAMAVMEAKLARERLYRWGAAWVTAAELDKLRAAEQANKAKLDELAVDFDAAEARISQIDQNINDNNQDMQRMQRDTLRYDSAGRLIRTDLPNTYYRLRDDNQRQLADRAREITKLEKLRTQARSIERNLPTPRYTGQQQIIGPEGTPLVPVVDAPSQPPPSTGPSTAPSTQPSA